MKASEAIQQIQADIAGVKATGVQQIAVANLDAYLATALQKAQAEESSDAGAAAQYQHDMDVWKARLPADTSHQIEMFKSVIEAGQTALRSAIVINGGAAAALLAFAGNALTKGQALAGDPLLSRIGTGLMCFVTGLGLAGLATGVRYLAQSAYAAWQASQISLAYQTRPQGPEPQARPQRRSMRVIAVTLNWVSVIVAAASFTAFFAGGYSAYVAIAKPGDTPIAHVAPPNAS